MNCTLGCSRGEWNPVVLTLPQLCSAGALNLTPQNVPYQSPPQPHPLAGAGLFLQGVISNLFPSVSKENRFDQLCRTPIYHQFIAALTHYLMQLPGMVLPLPLLEVRWAPLAPGTQNLRGSGILFYPRSESVFSLVPYHRMPWFEW